MATIGQALTTPESGWRRYDDTDSRIKYSANFVSGSNASCYNGTYHQKDTGKGIGNIITFKFYGTKLRIIGLLSSAYVPNVTVTLDGIQIGTFSESGGSTIWQALVFEKTGLTLGLHTVILSDTVDNSFLFDAIDIDSTGYLVHPTLNQVSDINTMQIGDCIPCRYTATTSGSAGNFSELGTCIANEIPIAGTATPNGLFYLIKVAKCTLIADRNIQHSISWDTLNVAKFIEGKYFVFNGKSTIIRSLMGGISYINSGGGISTTNNGLGTWPATNEWDTYIVNSNLNSKITVGDNNIWHWSGLFSWCKDIPITSIGANTSRCIRGNSTNLVYDNSTSSTVATYYGFRPILEYLEPNSKATTLYY